MYTRKAYLTGHHSRQKIGYLSLLNHSAHQIRCPAKPLQRYHEEVLHYRIHLRLCAFESCRPEPIKILSTKDYKALQDDNALQIVANSLVLHIGVSNTTTRTTHTLLDFKE